MLPSAIETSSAGPLRQAFRHLAVIGQERETTKSDLVHSIIYSSNVASQWKVSLDDSEISAQ